MAEAEDVGGPPDKVSEVEKERGEGSPLLLLLRREESLGG